MSIILTNNGKDAVRVEKGAMGHETNLQEYIHDNPESIPLYEIKEDIQLVILAREFQTNSGPIDALGVDQYGNIYIIETKLFTNTDKRRVVAQALDYGAALWRYSTDFSSFSATLDHYSHKSFHISVTEKLSEVFDFTLVQVEDLLSAVQENLSNGNFQFVILMDQLDDRLKDLIVYVNQNSRFTVYAVELEYYKHEAQEIVIPRLFGAEVKKDVGKSTAKKTPWDWDSFSRERLSDHGDSAVAVAARIIEWSKANGLEISWTSSNRGGYFLCFLVTKSWGFYPFAVTGEGVVGWNAPHQGDKSPEPFNQLEMRREIILRISEIAGAVTDEKNVDGYNGLKIPLDVLASEQNFMIFTDTCLWIQSELANHDSRSG